MYEIAILKDGEVVHKFLVTQEDTLSNTIFRGYVEDMIKGYVKKED